ncbi:MAG: DUF2225 domain-containing protein [Vallitaleaceae bacterium]|jgi:uncharacterized protein (DUF2225 family)|nr:DUF2225 domain-containing protein [Vallitaleaceae bacterium]
MDDGLYKAAIVCPVCENKFTTTRVRILAVKVESSDEDFCVHYEGLDPMLYEPWVCEYCGYTEFGIYFEKVNDNEKEVLKKLCLQKFTDDLTREPFDLSEFHEKVYAYFDMLGEDGERDYGSAIEVYKLLLWIQEVRNAPFSIRAKAALRIGWIYRMLGGEQEIQYLAMAAEYFTQAFEVEAFDDGGMDSETCAYMIGELNRRTGNVVKAIEWYGKALKISQENKNEKISNMIREQILLAKKEKELGKKSQ